jgi:DNA-directed RNA polymerase subunit omega
MSKQFNFSSDELMVRAEKLIKAASNRYQIVVQVALRAKKFRYHNFENLDDSNLKPVIQAVVEMSDELTEPEIISDN